MKALVNKIIPFSSVDGPGNRTAVFLQGCNFDCRYCHNPETIHLCSGCGACLEHCPTGALQKREGQITYDPALCAFCDACFLHCPHGASPRVRAMTAQQVMEQMQKNMPFIRGITVSGGECTRWPEFLRQLLTLAKEAKLHTLLDSNGSYDFSADDALMAVTDGVMLDVKAWDKAEHLRLTGMPNDQVLENLEFLAKQGKLEEVRTVVVPQFFDTEQTVRQVSRLLAPYAAKKSIRYKIICYRPMGVRPLYRDMQPPTAEWLAKLEQIAHEAGLRDTILI